MNQRNICVVCESGLMLTPGKDHDGRGDEGSIFFFGRGRLFSW
jgi:hypothetical protein